jgi:dipeptidyl aminopeptidase/acylaminoacyl peptidase
MIRYEPFVPHSYQQLLDTQTFVPPLPEKFYEGLVREYEALDVTTHRITYTSDGLNITGLCVMPTHISPKGHPVLIYNRGGKNEYGKLTLLSIMRSMAPFAQQGYLVFASNYRGNDGGEGADMFGGDDIHDVLELLALAKAHEGFDGRNVFMIGHSRGGMMTYLSLKHGAALNAAVSIAGISDVYRDGFTRAMPQNATETDRFNRSAQRWAAEIDTPLLLLHGTADDKVDASHSLELARLLGQIGRPHELELYEGGNHALVRQWDAVLTRISAWLEAHTR